MNEEHLKYIQAVDIICGAIAKDPKHAFEILDAIVIGLQEYKQKVDKQHSNLDLVIRNLKPEYLIEMKKLIIPEVFESLNLGKN